MAENPRSSFIPRHTPSGTATPVRKKRRFRLLDAAATVVLIASLALATGVFVYQNYEERSLVDKKAALDAERSRFSDSEIESVRELDRRIDAATYLLDRHISVSKIFDALELNTKTRVQFSSFTFAKSGEDTATLSLGGVTQEYKTVALQSLQFGKDSLLQTSAVTDLGTPGESSEDDAQTDITFGISVQVPENLILYDGKGVEVPSADTFETVEITGTTSAESGDDTATQEQAEDSAPSDTQ